MVNPDDQDEVEVPQTRVLNATESSQALDASTLDPAMADARERARKIYDGNEDFVSKEKAAAWMGEDSAMRSKTLAAYMNLYEFANLNILAALRSLCNRLVLKAESQQVDRILDAFAQRWCQCNPNHGFKVTG
jgi:Sec7-like guanine-nucleotide exchange factor